MSFWRVEAALRKVLPARVVTMLLAEPRGAVAVYHWILRRRPAGEAFSHHGDVVILLWVIVAMTVLEGVVVEVLLRVILGPSPWVWIALGLHAYAVYMIVAVYAGMVTRPHSLDDGALHLRTGLGAEVAVGLEAIDVVHAGRFPDFDRSGWRVDGDGNATLARGDANLRLELVPGALVVVNGVARNGIRAVHGTVDEPQRLAAAVMRAREAAAAVPER